MLFVIDIGNTNIVLGVFDNETIRAQWRAVTEKRKTADEYGIEIRDFFHYDDIHLEQIEGSIISCVVPTLQASFEQVCMKLFGRRPIVVGPGIKTGMPILYDNPKEVGADRIVNSVAAYHRFHDALISIDFGTATTFDVVSQKGEYLGGVICPGIGISLEALFFFASKLPRIEVGKPRSVIGKNTVESMQSGILYGYTGLVDGIIQRIWKEYGRKMKTIGTGGLCEMIAAESETIEEVDQSLTLQGLRLLYQLNKPTAK
jgi:type III pantothenate kinase